LLYDSFIDANLDVVSQLISESKNYPGLLIVLGFVERLSDGEGVLRNSAALITNGLLLGTQAKTLLPTYDVFDEDRYFEPGCGWRIFEWEGVKLGISVCEDLWDDNYDTKVVPSLKKLGAEVIINISASPFHVGKFNERCKLIRRHAVQNSIPLIYCNLVGGQDELIFDGASVAMGKDGRLSAHGKWFCEDGVLVEYDRKKADLIGQLEFPSLSREGELFEALKLGLADFVHKQGFSKVVLGLSGGIDSSLVAVISAHALGAENVLGVAMPSKISSSHSLEDARILAANLGIEFVVFEIEESIRVAEERYRRNFGEYRHMETRENLQARERGKILMEIANDQERFVLATGNKTEYALGYATLYGDMAGALAPIGDLSKLEVYAVARWANENMSRPIPERVLTKTPSAELSPGQVDPFDYEVVSPLVDLMVEEARSSDELIKQGYEADEVRRIERLLFKSEHKRWQAPPSLKVTKKAFGTGRKMPIVNKFTP
jgi:NAD+ synthetase